MSVLFEKILNKIKLKAYYEIKKYRENQLNKKLIKIRTLVNSITNNRENLSQKKILFTLNFSIYKPNKINDFLLSQSLILRGAHIIPVICGGVQKGQCSVAGGVWGNYIGDKEKDFFRKINNCKRCIKSDLDLWKNFSEKTPICLSRFIKTNDKKNIENIVTNYDISSYRDWKYDDIEVGSIILKTLRNNELLIDENKVKEREELIKNYLFNSILLIELFKRLLIDIKPFCIVTNNTFYYPWFYFEKIAKKFKIPIYPSGPGGKKNTWCYATDQRAMPVDKNAEKIWHFWQNKKLSKKEEFLIDDYLNNFSSGKSMIINTTGIDSKVKNKNHSFFEFLKGEEKVALLITNVAWDAAVLDVDYLFNDMFEWIFEVINFFSKNRQWKLIIKSHPAEIHKSFPESRQKVEDEILKKFKKIPENIFLLNPSFGISVYDLFSNINLGLVYSSTVGLEMVCRKIPVVPAGKAIYWNKGFTFDAKTKMQYFDYLKLLLNQGISEEEKDKRYILAKKFFYIFHFILYLDTGLFDWDAKQNINLKITHKDLLPGRNLVWDYICDSILEGKNIIDEYRFPPVVCNNKVITKSPRF
ncbi:hypothetical protein GF322_01645 [Candidatus Dependentiae bacterium]|nr:hypothetical protein [Candidatus Dependentiae bacterium]